MLDRETLRKDIINKLTQEPFLELKAISFYWKGPTGCRGHQINANLGRMCRCMRNPRTRGLKQEYRSEVQASQKDSQTNKNQIKTKKQRHWGQISRTFKTMCGRSNPPRFHSEGGHPTGPGSGKVLENDDTGSCQQDTHFQKSPKEITSCLEFYMLSNH